MIRNKFNFPIELQHIADIVFGNIFSLTTFYINNFCLSMNIDVLLCCRLVQYYKNASIHIQCFTLPHTIKGVYVKAKYYFSVFNVIHNGC